ncbi:MAG: hypothetical protein IJ733_15905 [Lachnospiraceae bacterium]|nr:hypothetical protein [Lachnospiraceae bacterium]
MSKNQQSNDLEELNYHFNYKEIEDIWHIMICLSDSTFSSPNISIGVNGTYMISCEAIMSVMNTLISIDFCCMRRAYSDAYTLIRKYRDDLMQYLFVLSVIDNIKGLTEEELKDIGLNEETILKIVELDFLILSSGKRKNDVELAIESWIYNELESSNNSSKRKEYFDTSKYKKYLINANNRIEYIMEHFLDDMWKKEDRKLNNYVHTNGKKYLTDNYAYQINRKQKEDELIETLQNITIVFLSLLSIVDSIKMHSSDYVDALDMGQEPVEDSQYWVCPAIVEYMNTKLDSNLLAYIQDNEQNGMKFLAGYYK